jgi:hypothetical protein
MWHQEHTMWAKYIEESSVSRERMRTCTRSTQHVQHVFYHENKAQLPRAQLVRQLHRH